MKYNLGYWMVTAVNSRDKAIVSDLLKFRCMDRDSIAELHVGENVKYPINAVNNILKRLVRDGHVTCSTQFSPYVYFHSETRIKSNSVKIPHYLEILNVYKDMLKYDKPYYVVEPKYSKGLVEPDAFAIFKGTPFFIEVQRSNITQKEIDNKIDLYHDLYSSGIVHGEVWQPKDRDPVFPYVLFITPFKFNIQSNLLQIRQVETIDTLLRPVMLESKKVNKQSIKSKGGIQIKIG